MSMFDPSEVRARSRPGECFLLDTPDARLRLAATTAMASTLVHEVNQPLTSAANYMHACALRLRGKGPGYEDVLAMIEDASRETLKAAEIIRRTRSFIVTGKIAAHRENLRTMIEQVASQLTLPETADIEIVKAVPLSHFVMVDRIQIEQVFSNLLRNACEALEGCKQPRIEIGAIEIGGKILVRIEDNGAGLGDAPERVFEPYFTTKKTGLGLGLPICKTIVEAHGGRIWAENGKRGGAVFNISLPVVELPAAEVPTRQRYG